jgi:hypothetical protein
MVKPKVELRMIRTVSNKKHVLLLSMAGSKKAIDIAEALWGRRPRS